MYNISEWILTILSIMMTIFGIYCMFSILKEIIRFKIREKEIEKRRHPEEYIKETRERIKAIENKLKERGIEEFTEEEEEPKEEFKEENKVTSSSNSIRTSSTINGLEVSYYNINKHAENHSDVDRCNAYRSILDQLNETNYPCAVVLDPDTIFDGYRKDQALFEVEHRLDRRYSRILIPINRDIARNLISAMITSIVTDGEAPMLYRKNILYKLADIQITKVIDDYDEAFSITFVFEKDASKVSDEFGYISIPLGKPYVVDCRKHL